jgi:hypothetical protein
MNMQAHVVDADRTPRMEPDYTLYYEIRFYGGAPARFEDWISLIQPDDLKSSDAHRFAPEQSKLFFQSRIQLQF